MRRRHLLVLAAVGVLPLVGCEPSDPAVERVSETNSGGTPNAPSYAPAISDNGRWVAFVSDASNIGFEFKDGVADVFVHDQSTDLTFSITTSGNGPSGWAPSCSTFEASSGCSDNPSQPEAPAISDDGGTVAFTSFATNLAGPVAAVPNVYAHRDGSGPMLASRSSAGAPANGPSFGVAVSGNGRFVSFWSYASNLVPGDTNESPDVFVHDLDTGATTRVNTTATGGQSGPSEETFETDSLGSELLSAYQPAPLSDDGRYVAFLSTRTDLAPGGSPRGNVYRKDRQTGAVIRVSDPALGDRAEAPFISADGNLVSFLTAFYVDVNEDAPCGFCFSYEPTAPPMRLVRDVNGGFNRELIPGNPFAGAPDVSGDGSLKTFAFGGDQPNIYVRHLPTTALAARHRINAGGPQFAGRFGKTWSADRGFVGGQTHVVTNAIDFAADDPLYQSERWGMSGYDLAVPDGRYRVRLLVAEISPATPRRVFDVRAEGALVVDDFDVRATFDAFEATTLEFVVPVTDGRLDLDFSSSSNAPTVAAIEVLDARLPDERI